MNQSIAMRAIRLSYAFSMSSQPSLVAKLEHDALRQGTRSVVRLQLCQARNHFGRRRNPSDAETRRHQFGECAEMKNERMMVQRLQCGDGVPLEADLAVGTILDDEDLLP